MSTFSLRRATIWVVITLFLVVSLTVSLASAQESGEGAAQTLPETLIEARRMVSADGNASDMLRLFVKSAGAMPDNQTGRTAAAALLSAAAALPISASKVQITACIDSLATAQAGARGIPGFAALPSEEANTLAEMVGQTCADDDESLAAKLHDYSCDFPVYANNASGSCCTGFGCGLKGYQRCFGARFACFKLGGDFDRD